MEKTQYNARPAQKSIFVTRIVNDTLLIFELQEAYAIIGEENTYDEVGKIVFRSVTKENRARKPFRIIPLFLQTIAAEEMRKRRGNL